MLAGVAYAATLYWRDRTLRDQAHWLNPVLGVARGLTVATICFLLLGPLFRSEVTDIRKPVVLLATDVSESMALGMRTGDSARLAAGFDALAQKLGDEFEVRRVAFGSSVREGNAVPMADKNSDLAAVFDYAAESFDRKTLGAVVMATDGIVNQGAGPQYAAERLGVSVYGVAVGDTVPKKDMAVKRVFHNNIVYLGDKFIIQTDVQAFNMAGVATSLQLSEVRGGQLKSLQSLPIQVQGNNFFITRELTLEATEPGIRHYKLSIGQPAGDANPSNNSRDFYVEVIDGRQKVLIVAYAPHPDIAALQAAIAKNKNYQVQVALASDPNLPLSTSDFVILHQLPAKGFAAESIFTALNNKNTPRLFVVGSQTDYGKLNGLQSVLQFAADGRQTNEVSAVVASDFTSFTIDPQLVKDLPTYNPVTAPFGDVKPVGSAQVLLYQRIGKVDTKYPLLAFNDQNGKRTGVLAAEHIWRWRLFDFLQHDSHKQSDDLVGKMVQYLSIKEDKRKFRVFVDKSVYKENEQVSFGAELYNDNYELINQPDVPLTLTNDGGKEFKYTFTRSGNAYTLKAGILPVGAYTFQSSVMYNGQNLTATGRFSVQEIQAERYETVANHSLLAGMTAQSGGRLVGIDSVSALADDIRNNARIKPVMYTSRKTAALLDQKWIFFLLLLLLGGEWFARRYYGAY